jgi:hypothetical protein
MALTIDLITSLAHKIMLHAFHVSVEFQICSVQPFPLAMPPTILLHQLEIQKNEKADKNSINI